MKKAKLFMMLALLVMGVSNTMGATKDFYVNYERDLLTGTGYSINTRSARNDGYTIQMFSQLPEAQGLGGVEDRMIRVTYEGSAPTAATIAEYITAVDKTGYTERVVGIDNTIYICYIWTEALATDWFGDPQTDIYGNYQLDNSVISDHEWPSGHFTYSDLYVKTNSTRVQNVIKLDDDECAVRLNTYTDSEVTIPLEDPVNRHKVVAIQYQGMCEKVNHSLSIVNCQKYDTDPTHTDSWWRDQARHNSRNGYKYSNEYGCYIREMTQTNDHSNGSLTKVTFDKDATTGQSNIRSFGDYAFQSCKVLQTIEIPQSLEYLGEACFSQCVGLTDGLTFQRTSGTEFKTNFKVIRNYTFWNCRNMTDLELPDGIIVIQGQQSGSSMQYMNSLTHLRLPNTLLAVGPHFLCDASSLTEVTIPASVKYIDGACFHGCESLETVYLLGPASALQGVYDGSDTFGSNLTMCKGNVSNCVFITTQDNIQGYAEDANGVWPLIADNQSGDCNGTNKLPLRAVKVNEDGEVIRNTTTGGFVYETGDKAYLKYKDGTTNVTTTTCSKGWGNALVYLSDQKVTFTPGKWVTVIFPKSYEWDKFKAEFGTDVILAKMVGYKTPDYKVKDGKIVYQLDFQAQNTVEKNTPYMIKPGHRIVGNNDPYEVVMIQANEMNEDYRKELSKDHALSADKGSFNTEIVMYGWFKKRDMKQWELYFQNPIDETTNEWNKHCVFKRIVDKNQAPKIRPFRCYWRIWLEGEDREDAGMSSAKSAFFRFADEDEQVTGIDQVDSNISIEIGNIYDLNGRKLDLKKEELPKGLFIIDGKKVMVK